MAKQAEYMNTHMYHWGACSVHEPKTGSDKELDESVCDFCHEPPRENIIHNPDLLLYYKVRCSVFDNPYCVK